MRGYVYDVVCKSLQGYTICDAEIYSCDHVATYPNRFEAEYECERLQQMLEGWESEDVYYTVVPRVVTAIKCDIPF